MPKGIGYGKLGKKVQKLIKENKKKEKAIAIAYSMVRGKRK